MKQEEISFYKKLQKIQDEIGPIKKDSTNPHFKSSYFDINSLLEKITPLIRSQNLMLLQPIAEGSVCSKIIDLETGHSEVSTIELPAETNPQKIGSCITYFRRYTLQSLLALEAEDDDGNKAAGVAPSKNEDNNDNKPWLNITDKSKNITPQWSNVSAAIAAGKITSIAQVREHYKVNKAVAKTLEDILTDQAAA